MLENTLTGNTSSPHSKPLTGRIAPPVLPAVPPKRNRYNDIALRLGNKLLGLKHLHYGYFTKDLEPTVQNLPAAQDAYVAQLLAHVPTSGVQTVMDIGCGTGTVAKAFLEKGYEVTSVDPDPFMISKAYETTGGRIHTQVSPYQDLETLPPTAPQVFDLILMSESCQYVPHEKQWAQHARFCRTGGHVLLADFFKVRELDQPYLSKSGHPLEPFMEASRKNGFELVKRTDITTEVAPTMDIYQDLITNKIFPVAEGIFEYVQRRHPWVYRGLALLFRKRLLKIREKYSHQSAEEFVRYKNYLILLFRKK